MLLACRPPICHGLLATSSKPWHTFFDPADDVVEAVAPYVITGSGTFPTLVSGRQGYDVADFRRMLEYLGLDLAIEPG
jgi:hypothetical protein